MFYTIKPGDTVYEIASQHHTTVSAILAANPGLTLYNLMIGQQIFIPSAGQTSDQSAAGISANELKLRNTLRALWEQHVAWTRMAILSAASNSPDLDLVVKRLLRNATDMANALRPIYGDYNADMFGRLIHAHLAIALELVKAAKAGDTQAAQNAEKQWYHNADQIASFLVSINPYIDREAFRRMFHSHLAMTKEEAVERLNHNYAKDIALYDQIESQALEMADSMADAIVKQFPNIYR